MAEWSIALVLKTSEGASSPGVRIPPYPPLIFFAMKFVIDKDIKQITEEDLQNLVNNKRQEDTFLDFKRDCYGRTDTDKKELLKDVSAFANGSGGEIIIGIEEDNYSQAKNLCGFVSKNIAIEKNRIEQIILNGLEPKLDTFKVRYINLKNGKISLGDLS